MNYDNFLTNIEDKISFFKKENNTTELGRFRWHKTILNKLVLKYELVEKEPLLPYFYDDFPQVESSFKSIIKEEGKDPRTPSSRLRSLRDYYHSINDIEVSNYPVSEILTDAAKRMYGDRFYDGEITPKNQLKITNKYITIRAIAKDLIEAGIKEDPTLWKAVSLDKSKLSSASKVVRDYFTGDSVPTERVSDERILFIEKYMGLPKKSILNKVIRKKTISAFNERRRKIAKKNKENLSAEKTIEDDFYKTKTLNKHLTKVFDEYKAFKTDGLQPVIKNISDVMKSFSGLGFDIEVKEKTKRSSNAWTKNAQGSYPSATGFYKHLLFFQNYCINIENIKFDNVSSEHLTKYKLLKRISLYAKNQKRFGTSADRILNFINLGAQSRGYLRLCADPGDRELENFFYELDYIRDNYDEMSSDAKKGIKHRGDGSKGSQGKENIEFLLDMPFKERRELCHEASIWLIDKSDSFLEESKKELKAFNKARNEKSGLKRFDKAGFFAMKSFSRIISAVILESSFVNAPRAINWSTLKYCQSAKYKEDGVPSLTYHSHKNRFEINIPLYGYDISKENEHVRLIKNSDAENVKPVNLFFPEYLTPIIKKLIEVRRIYIDTHMVTQVRKAIPKIKKGLSELNALTTSGLEHEIENLKAKSTELKALDIEHHDYKLEAIEVDKDIENSFLQRYIAILSNIELNNKKRKIELSDIYASIISVEAKIEELTLLTNIDHRNYLKQHAKLDITAFENFSTSDIDLLLPSASYRLGETKKGISSADRKEWETNRLLRRHFYNPPSKLSDSFKAMTCDAFHEICDENQWGINIHALRHLVARTYLDEYPGDWEGAAAILNDDIEQIIKIYGNKDRSKTMKEVADKESCIKIKY
jgi:hypothetical protein